VFSAAALIAVAAVSGVPDQIFFSSMEPDVCPAGRILTSDVSYDLGGTDRGVDVTRFENLWGRINAIDPPTPWPGVTGASPRIKQFMRTGYVAAAFHSSAELPATLSGMFKNVSYGQGPAIDISIGPCGVFSSSLGPCFAANVLATDQPMLHWRPTNPNPLWCIIAPDTDYYLNLRLSDPDDDAASCLDDHCGVTTSSYVGQ
jgi:hypothetical protein